MTAARHVVAVVPDLMDRSRLRADGVEVTVVPPGRLADAVGGARPVDLVVVDLSRPGAVEAVSGLGVPVVGFAPHVDDTLLAAARAAGIEALPRSTFFRRWPAVGPAGD
ncbi:MAG TPA: hypothetical protein VEW93_00700 [Acidimicrobiales bacterium]|nr:hypothetical protein [Acidimicrobiales bacterium]